MAAFCQALSAISIHALLAESDSPEMPTQEEIEISIHALLAESDPPLLEAAFGHRDFYPRSPCGERPVGVFPVILII